MQLLERRTSGEFICLSDVDRKSGTNSWWTVDRYVGSSDGLHKFNLNRKLNKKFKSGFNNWIWMEIVKKNNLTTSSNQAGKYNNTYLPHGGCVVWFSVPSSKNCIHLFTITAEFEGFRTYYTFPELVIICHSYLPGVDLNEEEMTK